MSGEIRSMPAPPPAETMPTASPRLAVNHLVAVAERGVRNAPAAKPTIAPNVTWRCQSAVALARKDQSEAEEESARDGHQATAEAVRHRAPEERPGAHADPVDQRRRRDGAPAPVHRILERLQEDAEGEERSLSEGDDRGRGGEHHPAIEESALTHGSELR